MSKDWNPKQKEAIYHYGENILVSAGAGSGKTSVLTERVIRMLKEGVSIQDLLVLTFTRAAASEMKERIRKAIYKFDELKDQLDYLDNAYITTFDSFAFSIVKKYHYLLGLSNNLTIIDENILQLEKIKILDTILEEKYQKKEESFLSLIANFCLKNDNELKKSILNIDSKLNLIIDKEEYINEYIEKYYDKSKIMSYINEFSNSVMAIHDKILNLFYEIENSLESEVEYEKFAIYENLLSTLIAAKDYNQVISSCNFSAPNFKISQNKIFSENKKSITALVNKLKTFLIYPSLDDIYEKIIKTKENVIEIVEIIKELNKRLSLLKNKKEIFDFNDIAKMAMTIIKDNPQIKEDIKSSFFEILLDEYQDTSDLQDEFISLIANNNVYMVGDVKQSIYRFRNANPNLFIKKYGEYSNHLNGYKIDLNVNYRSRREVLNDINTLFSKMMTLDLGGADYLGSHMIEFGSDKYESEGKTQQDYHLEVLSYDLKKSIFKEEEIEAFIIAQDIKKKIDGGYLIYNSDDLVRKIKYSDITILIDKSNDFVLYKKIFEYFNIPLSILRNEDIKMEDDVIALKNLLKLTYKYAKNEFDKEFKKSFASVARSFLFEMDDNELFVILQERRYKDNIIYEKLSSLVNEIEVYSPSQVLEKIIKITDFYFQVIKIGNVKQSHIRLDNIIKIGKNMEDLGYTIIEIIEYLDQIMINNFKLEIPPSSDSSNSVKIMTIHNSKGLEFPLCYYAGFSSKFNQDELKNDILFSMDEGIIIPFINQEKMDNILKIIYKNKYFKEEISEKIRLLYVAFTRSKEKMIMVGQFNQNKEEEKKEVTDSKSLIQLLSFYKDSFSECIKEIDLDSLNLTKDYILSKDTKYKTFINKAEIKIKHISINSIDNELHKKSYSKKENRLIDMDVSNMLKEGDLIHNYLYLIDFKRKNIKDFVSNKKVEFMINNFLNSDLLKDLDKAIIYKEHEFIQKDEKEIKRGIIDLMLEYDDHIKIIDYKLKNISDEEYDKQLKGYFNHISQLTSKRIDLYLYSLIDSVYRKVN